MDMQHREHSKHNEYTYGWIFIQEIYLITCLTISSYNRVILSINFFSYDFVTIKWMDSNGKLYFRNVSHFDWIKTGKFPELNQLHGVYS